MSNHMLYKVWDIIIIHAGIEINSSVCFPDRLLFSPSTWLPVYMFVHLQDRQSVCYSVYQCPLLLTWFNFKPNMDE